jgi:hypothetical protein
VTITNKRKSLKLDCGENGLRMVAGNWRRKMRCPVCDGKGGYIEHYDYAYGYVPCAYCTGTGYVSFREWFNVWFWEQFLPLSVCVWILDRCIWIIERYEELINLVDETKSKGEIK